LKRTFLLLGAVAAVCLLAVPAAAQSDEQRKEVEEAQKKAVEEIKPTLPKKIDEITTLIDIAAYGVILAYTYSINTAKFKMMPDFIERVRKNTTLTVCKNDDLVQAMKLGAIYQYIYFDPKSKPLGRFDVKSTECV